ncbi:MAG: hypothetical protein L6R40_003949 [Gallowayella cf. fulva]|nr:MAG: hypothetical protein L6R40_003949 [Xanthomendoza cf. fulva]
MEARLSKYRSQSRNIGEVKDADYVDISKAIKDWVIDHPNEVAQYAATGVVILYPGIVVAPILRVVGFASGGVVAGSAAATHQASLSPVAAKSIFSTLQSAGAGGYGLAVANGVVRAGGAVVNAVPVYQKLFNQGGQQHPSHSRTTNSDVCKEGDNLQQSNGQVEDSQSTGLRKLKKFHFFKRGDPDVVSYSYLKPSIANFMGRNSHDRTSDMRPPYRKWYVQSTAFQTLRITAPLSLPGRRTFAASAPQHFKNRVYTSVRSEAELSSLLSLSTANKTPLITLWTASWCPSCRTIRPFLTDLIEHDAHGEAHGGVGYAEVEMDSPDIGALAGNKYFITSIPTLLSFRAGEAALDTKLTSVAEMKDKEFMKLWIEDEARRGGERGGGGGVTTGFLGALFGVKEK